MKLYLIMSSPGDKGDVVRAIFSGYTGFTFLGLSQNALEAMNMIKNKNPRVVMLDKKAFRGKGLELLLRILRKREMSAAVCLWGSEKSAGVTSVSVNLPSDSSKNSSTVLALLKDIFDGYYTQQAM
ncbi:MAG TPA: hypothetical protein VEI28_06900 [Thermodesulfovibrionales bacterium]|nr:hypothetical protein [Thermodesulfovibrionales bacterium]